MQHCSTTPKAFVITERKLACLLLKHGGQAQSACMCCEGMLMVTGKTVGPRTCFMSAVMVRMRTRRPSFCPMKLNAYV